MKRALLLAVLLGLVLPAVAEAQPCYCVWRYAKEYTDNDKTGDGMRVRADIKMIQRHISLKKRKQVRDAVYDWKRRGDFDASWCKQYPKVCKAAKACLIAAGGSTLYSLNDGRYTPKEAYQAAVACGTAAAATLVT